MFTIFYTVHIHCIISVPHFSSRFNIKKEKLKTLTDHRIKLGMLPTPAGILAGPALICISKTELYSWHQLYSQSADNPLSKVFLVALLGSIVCN